MHPNDWNPFSDKEKPTNTTRPTIADMEQLKCLKCENTLFDRYFKLYKYSENGNNQIYNIPVSVCGNCGEVLDVKKIEETVDKPS